MFERLKYLSRVNRTRPRRYRNLLKTVNAGKCRNIMEIGVYRGKHARQMIEVAKIFHPVGEINYYGFDLFEHLTDEDFEREQAKRPPSCAAVQENLERTGANIHLYAGYTRDTLPDFVEEVRAKNIAIDIAFIDGGHSIETITCDWNFVKEVMNEGTVVVFDDYYSNTEPEIEGLGCQTLIESLDRDKYIVEIFQPADVFEREWGQLKTSIVKVWFRRS